MPKFFSDRFLIALLWKIFPVFLQRFDPLFPLFLIEDAQPRAGVSEVLEILNGLFMLFGRFDGGECAQVPALVRFGILFPRVDAKLTGF
jgi:hypothetical protein